MRVEITPTEKPERLAENLEKRVEDVSLEDGGLVVEVEDPEVLSRTPGIESFTVNGEEREGLDGSPVETQAYARLESRRDAVEALIATVMGYDLRILDTSREWDYRSLKRYNPDMKHLRFDGPRDELEIDYALFDAPGLEKVEVDPDEEEVEQLYRERLA